MQPASMTSSTLKKIFFEDVILLTDEFCFQRSTSRDDMNTSNAEEMSENSTDEEGAESDVDSDNNSETESKPERKRSNSEEIKPLKLGSLLGKN